VILVLEVNLAMTTSDLYQALVAGGLVKISPSRRPMRLESTFVAASVLINPKPFLFRVHSFCVRSRRFSWRRGSDISQALFKQR
jgi:hypothetical protein